MAFLGARALPPQAVIMVTFIMAAEENDPPCFVHGVGIMTCSTTSFTWEATIFNARSPKLVFFLTALLLVLSACQSGGLSAEQLASTTVAETAAAAPTAAPPTRIPPTNTPAPLIVQDDFSSKSDIWGECERCEWKDGALYFGPYPAKESMGQDQIFYVICEACGKLENYRMAADVTFFDGFGGDRTFGLLAGLTDDNFLGAATITTHQHALYETFDFNTQEWGGTPFELFKSAVLYGAGATNRIEVQVRPTVPRGSVKVTVHVNGTETVTYILPSAPVQVGLYLGWHSVGVIYDNFEFEEFMR